MKRSVSTIMFDQWIENLNQKKKIPKPSPMKRDNTAIKNDTGSSSIEQGSFLNPFAVNYYGNNEITPEKKKKKKSNSSSASIVEITKGEFEAAVEKHSSTVTYDYEGEVKESSSWEKYQCLGRGSYGSVYLATEKSDKDQKLMAIKSAEISKASSLMMEERILTRLSSPFVVQCYGHEVALEQASIGGLKTNYNLILEYCSGKSLAELIKNNRAGLLEKDVKVFAKDILDGLDYIHRENIIHCDIKPDNILLTPVDNQIRPNGYVTKIGDFGFSLEKGSSEYVNASGPRGTTRYMAPELISHEVVDFGIDTWAYGCTVLEMLTGKAPWEEHSEAATVYLEDLIGESCYIPYIPDWLSEEAQDFVGRCLVKDLGLRSEIGALMNHPFFKLDVESSDNGFVYDSD